MAMSRGTSISALASMIELESSTDFCPSDSPSASRKVASDTKPRLTSYLPTGWFDFICSSSASRNWSSLMTPSAINVWPMGRRLVFGEFIRSRLTGNPGFPDSFVKAVAAISAIARLQFAGDAVERQIRS